MTMCAPALHQNLLLLWSVWHCVPSLRLPNVQMDAVERLMRLPLKATAARDIAHVLMHCCMQEERWNPFYAHVASELLSHGKAYRSSFQFAVQDQARRVPELNARQATNLASLLAHLLARQVNYRILVLTGGYIEFRWLSPVKYDLSWLATWCRVYH